MGDPAPRDLLETGLAYNGLSQTSTVKPTQNLSTRIRPEHHTRKSSHSETLIDHFAIRGDGKEFGVYNMTHDISDHNILVLEVYGNHSKETVKQDDAADTPIINYRKLREYLRETSIDRDDQEDVDKSVNSLVDYVKRGIMKCKK